MFNQDFFVFRPFLMAVALTLEIFSRNKRISRQATFAAAALVDWGEEWMGEVRAVYGIVGGIVRVVLGI